MQINNGYDDETWADVAFATDHLSPLIEQLVVSHYRQRGSKQRACAVVLSAMGAVAVNALANMAKAMGVDYSMDDRDMAAKALQNAMNEEIMKIVGRQPNVGN